MKQRAWLTGLVVVVVMVSVSAFFGFKQKSQLPEQLRSVAVEPPEPLQPIKLIDHNNQRVDLARLHAKWTFLFFGFTNCPDVCPATLSQLTMLNKRIVNKLKNSVARDNNVQFFFVSVDPERDTLKHLSDYVSYFGPHFIGMTSDEAGLLDLETQLNAYHRIGKKDSANHYTVNHSAAVYLIDPAARLAARFMPPMDPAQVAEQLYEFIAFYSQPAG